jgi:hypothetical protein
MQPKVCIADAGGQGRLTAALLAATLTLLMVACEHERGRTILVQADTTRASGRTDEAGSSQDPEIALLDAESLATGDRAAGAAASSRDAQAGRASFAGPARPGDAPANEPDEGLGGTADEIRERGGRPPPPVLLPAGRVLLPAGTVFAVELRTPIHTATTIIGDRFAARLTQDVAAGGRVVIAAGALVEGRVSKVGSASEPGRIAFIELQARKVRMTDERHLRITAHVLDVTGQEVIGSTEDGRRSRLVTGPEGAQLSQAAREARATILAGILDSVAGRAIVASSTDREIIIPTGTPFTLMLAEPLEIPAP